MSTVLTEGTHDGAFLVDELPGRMSRTSGTVNSGQNLAAGTIVGQLLDVGAAIAVGTPTGNGLITLGAPGTAVQVGTYKLVCVAAAGNGGTFNFYAPNGQLIRQVTVAGGAAANDHFAVTIADGGNDFAVNDTFTVTVAGGNFEALDPAGTDGTQIAAAILFGAVDATDVDQPGVFVHQFAVIASGELVWPEGITTPQKASATAQLAARNLVLR